MEFVSFLKYLEANNLNDAHEYFDKSISKYQDPNYELTIVQSMVDFFKSVGYNYVSNTIDNFELDKILKQFNTNFKDRFKKVEFDEAKQQFIIAYNYPYLKKYALIFLIIGIILATICGLLMQDSFLIGVVCLSLLAFPFIAFGGRLLFISFQKQKIIIDLGSKKILFNKNLTIPFHSISQFSLVQERYYDVEYPIQFLKMKKVTSWQITIEDFKGNKVILCKSEKKAQAKKIVEEFSQAMGVKLKEGIEIC